MLAEVKVAAVAAAGERVEMWLTVSGSTMDHSQTESLAASISGPEQDTGVGAPPLTAISALDRATDPRRTWAAAGWTGAACLLFGGVVATAGAGRSRRRRPPQSASEEPVASGER